ARRRGRRRDRRGGPRAFLDALTETPDVRVGIAAGRDVLAAGDVLALGLRQLCRVDVGATLDIRLALATFEEHYLTLIDADEVGGVFCSTSTSTQRIDGACQTAQHLLNLPSVPSPPPCFHSCSFPSHCSFPVFLFIRF